MRMTAFSSNPPVPMPIPPEHVKRFIQEHIAEIQGPRDVAEGMRYAYDTLRKDFKRQEGITLGVYLTQVRVERAKQLLIETEMRSSEIAYAVGFSREEVAAKAFKKETGLSMQAYRKHHDAA